MKPNRSVPALAFLLSATCVLADTFPPDLDATTFSGPDIAPCPACLCVSAKGEVFAGVDLNGSLGKGPGKGRIVKLVDKDHDGVADGHTDFAPIDNPRGLIAIGTKVYVLHTAFGADGKSTGMNLVVLEDADGDGVADGPAKPLVTGICSAANINARGTDHSTNGIRMGIDGWIYIAVGDFGFADATGTDGTKLTLLGGGIARVRPDGAELEMYTTGTRNIYDVAIDPFMNCFTRGNTNDGGGWNVRFLHHLQSGEYGYPRLFINFADEIIPALEDLGGGSGVGSLYLSEPTWPAQYNNQPLMADWGRKVVYIHRLTADGASFKQKPEQFVQVSQVTDLDVDPSGQMFVSAWDGAGFKGDPKKGYVVRLTPKGWKASEPFDFAKAAVPALVEKIGSTSATARFYAQQALLARPSAEALAARPALSALARNAALTAEARVAALFTLAQIETDPKALLAFASDATLREFALRAATDRLPRLKGAALPLEPFVQALREGNPRQQAAAAVGMGRLGDPKAAAALLAVPFTKPAPEGAANASEKTTVKRGRLANAKLAVTPGDELRLHVSSTEDANKPAALAVSGAVFTLADKTQVPLASLKPKSGAATVAEAPAAPPAGGKGKGAAATGPIITANGPAPVVYIVPANAVAFSADAGSVNPADQDLSAEFFVSTGKPGAAAQQGSSAPRHATPNSAILVPHLAAHALMRLRAVDPCLAAIGTKSEDLALWALSGIHDERAVDGLLGKLKATTTPATPATPGQRNKLLSTLGRLYQQEAPYDGSWWWSTRPDTRGPYYKPVTWAPSPRIAAALEAEADKPEQLEFLAKLNDSQRLGLAKLGSRQTAATAPKVPTVDLAKIASQKGAVATTPVEDVVLAMSKLKPNPARGEALFTQQGCVACHALKPGGPALGPFMGQIGSIMNVEQIATAILRPSDTISQGFQSISLTMKDGSVRTGFASETTADKIMLRDPSGAVTPIAKADIKEEKHLPNSMMPEGLANALSLDDFAALVHFLAAHK